MTAARMLQRLVIAEAIFQEAKIAAIARRLGVSRSWAGREANAPQTKVLLTALVEQSLGGASHALGERND
jgi:hypothetical protein